MQTSQIPPEYPDFETLETDRVFMGEPSQVVQEQQYENEVVSQALFNYYNED